MEGCRDGTVGGSHSCLFSMVANLERRRFFPIVIFYYDNIVARKLRGLGIETHVLRSFTPLNMGMLLESAPAFLKKIYPMFLFLQKSLNFLWFFIRPSILYAWFIKKRRIDIVHLNNSLKTNHDWMLGAKIARAKCITHERGINENLPITAKFFGKRLDAVICITKLIFRNLVRQGLPGEKLKVVYDGIDFENIRVKEDKTSIRKKYAIKEGDRVIGVVGNIKEWKGQETAVRATAILKKDWPGIKCLLVGGMYDNDPYIGKLQKIIEESEIENNVIFTGFQENPADFMNIMDVVVHSSIAPEPFGMVNLEAMFMKKSVISTNIGGPTEIFENGEDGNLIEPGNQELLALKVSRLLENPELRREMGQKAQETVIGRFKISDTVLRIEETYDEVCRK